MAKTKKAKRAAREKVLTRRMKEQTRNAAKIVKRIAKIKKELWEIELDEFQETGLLQQLTWEYVDRVRLLGATAIGFRSKENVSNSVAANKVQQWIWLNRDEKEDDVRLFRTTINKYRILIALQMDYAEDDDDSEDESRMHVTIFAIDVEETGTGHDAEKKALNNFAEKWNIKAEII
jgi:hypothetical protein